MENDHVSIENRWDVGLIDLGNRDRWRGYIVHELQFWETPQERVVGLEGLDGFVVAPVDAHVHGCKQGGVVRCH